jgi:hypothetical protein
LTLALCITLVVTGCGAGVGDVSGKVTYKNKPVVYGSVSFVGPDGISRAARINSDGTYSVKDVGAGEAKVTVESVLPNPKGGDGGRVARPGGDEKLPEGMPKRERRGEDTPEVVDPEIAKNWFPIPRDYADIGKTKLRFTLRRGPNTYDIQLD